MGENPVAALYSHSCHTPEHHRMMCTETCAGVRSGSMNGRLGTHLTTQSPHMSIRMPGGILSCITSLAPCVSLLLPCTSTP